MTKEFTIANLLFKAGINDIDGIDDVSVILHKQGYTNMKVTLEIDNDKTQAQWKRVMNRLDGIKKLEEF